jgi:hypothetical protein
MNKRNLSQPLISFNDNIIFNICCLPPFFLGNFFRIGSNGDRLNQKLRNRKIPEFFYVIMARFCNVICGSVIA